MAISQEALWAYLPESNAAAIEVSIRVYEELRAEQYMRAGQVEVGWAFHYRNQGRLLVVESSRRGYR